MIHIRLQYPESKPAIIKLVAGFLLKGKVIILPTDTIYGLSCLASDQKAVRRIYKLKGRPPGKPFIILVSSLQQLKKYAAITPRQQEVIKEIWRSARPTTVLLSAKSGVLPDLVGRDGTLAIRLPKSLFLIKILKAVRAPIVSTSLNLSGQKSLSSLRGIEEFFKKNSGRPDLAIDSGKCRRIRASRLVDIRGASPVVLRK